MLIDDPDPHRSTAKLAGDIAYKGLKAVLDVIDKVGYALPPLKAAAAGLGSVLTVIDVCTFAVGDCAGTNESHEAENNKE